MSKIRSPSIRIVCPGRSPETASITVTLVTAMPEGTTGDAPPQAGSAIASKAIAAGTISAPVRFLLFMR